MQRVGRINRVGSSNEKLYIYNFFPSESAKEHLSLEDAIKTKINLFHNLLGDDVKTITDDEVTESHGLYDSVLKVNDLSSYDSDDINENESELQYIQLAKEIKKSNKQLYKKIMELPLKFRVATSSQGNNGLVTLIKCGLNKKFIYCDKDNNCESTEIPFDEAIQLIKCDETKKSIKVPQDYFDLYNKNLDTYEGINHIYEITNIKSGHSESKKEKEINKYIQVLLASSDIDTQDREYLKNIQTSIKNGRFNAKDFSVIQNQIKKPISYEKILKAFKDNIKPYMLEERTNYKTSLTDLENKVIVLSKYLDKEIK